MYLPTDRIQQILSCARCAALRQPTVPTGQNSCSEGLQSFGFPPLLPDRPPWQARAGLRLLYVSTSHRLPLLGEGYSLSSSVRVSKCWIVLAKALSGRDKWTERLGPRMSWRLKQHLPFVKVINFQANCLWTSWGCLSYYWNAAVSRAEGSTTEQYAETSQCNNRNNSCL